MTWKKKGRNTDVEVEVPIAEDEGIHDLVVDIVTIHRDQEAIPGDDATAQGLQVILAEEEHTARDREVIRGEETGRRDLTAKLLTQATVEQRVARIVEDL